MNPRHNQINEIKMSTQDTETNFNKKIEKLKKTQWNEARNDKFSKQNKKLRWVKSLTNRIMWMTHDNVNDTTLGPEDKIKELNIQGINMIAF